MMKVNRKRGICSIPLQGRYMNKSDAIQFKQTQAHKQIIIRSNNSMIIVLYQIKSTAETIKNTPFV